MATGGQIQPPAPDWVSPFDLDGVTNDGYPFIADQTPPPDYSPTNGATIWVLDGSFDGYPYIRANGLPGAIDHDRAASIWGLHPSINDGYPYIRAVEPVPAAKAMRITGFLVEGNGAHFREISQELPVSIPDEVVAKWRERAPVYFEFRVKEG